MHFQSERERDHALLKLSLIALYMILGYDALATIVGYFIVKINIDANGSKLIRNAVFLIAIIDLAAIYWVKRVMLRIALSGDSGPDYNVEIHYRQLFRITIIIAAMCIAISTYGLILVIFGEKFEVLMLFIAISLIGYQFFRLRPRDFPDSTKTMES